MAIGKFFTAIKDGAWHNIDELSEQLQLQSDKLIEFSKFLNEQGFIKYEERSNRIKIEHMWQSVLPEEEDSSETETAYCIATLTIPPETSIDIQSTKITNLSNVEVEVKMQIDSRIKEVAIKI